MYRVLVADDEPIERMVITKKLNQLFQKRIEVVQAENGKDALELYQKEKCRIAILDINMPGMNGLETARQIRSLGSNPILIFLTAYDEFDYAKQAFAVRALDYLLKPSSDEELEAVMEEALRLAEEQDASQKKKEEGETIPDDMQKNVQDADEAVKDNIRMRAIAGDILNYIDEHYKSDISLQDIASSLNYSDAYFCKIFRQCFSKNFTGYLTEYRIEKAKQLLSDIRINIKDVSIQVGIRDSNYFARIFKRYVGKTPREYRNSVLEKQV
ncbi:MAG: response regulator [Muricoprocola sp.]